MKVTFMFLKQQQGQTSFEKFGGKSPEESVITLACEDIRAKEKSIQNDRFVSREIGQFWGQMLIDRAEKAPKRSQRKGMGDNG